MKPEEFVERLDNPRIVAAIAAAEKQTSGEIRVFIHRGKLPGDPLVSAGEKFIEFGMTSTAERNGVLIFLAPLAQKFAVVGDEGVHRQCGIEFWNGLVAQMRAHFQREEFTDALVEAIENVGRLLAQHFPRRSDDRNELPDSVIEG